MSLDEALRVRVFEIVQCDSNDGRPPHPVIAEGITPELLRACKLAPVPILVQDLAEDDWAGFCADTSYTVCSEIVLNRASLDAIARRRNPHRRVQAIRALYAHECTHRLLGESGATGHDGRFLCMNLVLVLRARRLADKKYDLLNKLSLYDIQDDKERLTRVISWAWNLATELAAKPLSAAECAPIIHRSYQRWSERRNTFPELVRQRNIDKKNNERLIKELKNDRIFFSISAFIIGIIGTTLLFVLKYLY